MKKIERLFSTIVMLVVCVAVLTACGIDGVTSLTKTSHIPGVATATPVTPPVEQVKPVATHIPVKPVLVAAKPALTPTVAPSRPTPVPTQAITPTSSSTGNYATSTAAAQAVFQLINQERASKRLPALQWSDALVRSAHLHNILMFQANTLSHQLAGEADLFTRINAQGIAGNQFAENIGYGWGSAVQAATGLNAWMFAETPPDDGHRLNILSRATIVGVDVIVNPRISQVWLTEDFAQTL